MAEGSVSGGSVYGVSREDQAQDFREVRRRMEHMDAAALGVTEWMDNVVEGDVDEGSSGSTGVEAGAVAVAILGLKELGVRVQRSKRAELLGHFWRGRPVRAAAPRQEQILMRQFSVAGSTLVTEFDTAGGLYEELASGKRVVTQLLARTGLGKTVKLPAGIVRNARKSVLVLEPDVKLARYAADMARKSVEVRRAWQEGMGPCVVTMSYMDFCGHFYGQNGINMLKAFDVIMFDESHCVMPEINVAKILVATFGPKTLSVILCSATLEGEDVQSTGKAIAPIQADVTLPEFVALGHLWRGPYAKDRTLILTKSNKEAYEIESEIAANGFEVKLLDSASRFSDVEQARDFMRSADSVTNRYVVAVAGYGIGYNHICDFVLTAAEEEISYIDELKKTVVTTTVKCDETVLKQHIGRAGREGSASVKAVVCETSAVDGVVSRTMTYSQRVKSYFLLRVAGVVPVKGMYDDIERTLLPYGVTRSVAADVLALNMLPELAIRFFAKDGKIPARFASALEAFCVQDHTFYTSDYEDPVGYESWVEESVGSYYSAEENAGISVKVPLYSSGDVKVMLHTVAAVSAGLMEIENWRCVTSDVEAEDVIKQHNRRTSVGGVYRPRLVENAALAPSQPVITNYAYNVPVSEQRGGVQYLSAELAAAMANFVQRDLMCGANDFDVHCDITEVTERGVERVGLIANPVEKFSVVAHESPLVDIHSPGESIVVSFRKSVWEKMVAGKALVGKDAQSFFNAVKSNVDGFVSSDAFSGWTDVWLSMFATFSDDGNINLIKKMNLIERATNLLLGLVQRYVTAVSAVSRSSYVKAGILKLMMNGGSLEKTIEKSRSKGKAEIVQSRRFYERLYLIRDRLVEVVEAFEESNVFSPAMVINLQRLLPIMRPSGNRVFDMPTEKRNRFVNRFLITDK